jgi:hypothetical protein|tara:strand:+ start:492 stop:914 length:423 start_codon:yes stop_codon:yes gene_type:complete
MIEFILPCVLGYTSVPPADDMNMVLNAIRIVESSGNDDAVGDNGNAIGPFQIWEVYWMDATEFSGLDGDYRNCYDRKYAERIVRSYMKRYATEKRLGRTVNMQDIARIHNGGPNGYRKDSTLGYWKKVKIQLRKLGWDGN